MKTQDSKIKLKLYLNYQSISYCRLTKDRTQLFHHIEAKLLYLSRRTHQDIQSAVAFLCTRVQKLDMDDYKKLAKVMGGQFVQGSTRYEK